MHTLNSNTVLRRAGRVGDGEPWPRGSEKDTRTSRPWPFLLLLIGIALAHLFLAIRFPELFAPPFERF